MSGSRDGSAESKARRGRRPPTPTHLYPDVPSAGEALGCEMEFGVVLLGTSEQEHESFSHWTGDNRTRTITTPSSPYLALAEASRMCVCAFTRDKGNSPLPCVPP
jgi:hypothetical protein